MYQAVVAREQVEQADALKVALWKRLVESISSRDRDLLYAYESLAVMRDIAAHHLRWGPEMTPDKALDWFREAVQHAEHTLAMAVARDSA